MFNPQHENQVIFDPHTKTKSISKSISTAPQKAVHVGPPTRKQVYRFRHWNQVNFDPTLNGIHFRPPHKNQINFDPPLKDQVNFLGVVEGSRSFSVSANVIPLTVPRLSHVRGMCRVPHVLCAMHHAWSVFKSFLVVGSPRFCAGEAFFTLSATTYTYYTYTYWHIHRHT